MGACIKHVNDNVNADILLSFCTGAVIVRWKSSVWSSSGTLYPQCGTPTLSQWRRWAADWYTRTRRTATDAQQFVQIR